MNCLIDILRRLLPPAFAIAFVHAVYFAYFRWLHAGLKYPDLFPIMFLAIFLSWKFIIRKPVTDLGIVFCDKQRFMNEFLRGVRYGALVTAISLACAVFAGQVHISLNMENLRRSGYGLFPAAAYLIFVPISAAYEELHYRGLYLGAFSGKWVPFLMVPLSSAVFAAVHLEVLHPPVYAGMLFLIGMLLALIRWRTGSLLVCIGFHSAWNYILVCLAPFFNETTERYLEFVPITCYILGLVLLWEVVFLARTGFVPSILATGQEP
ncbi:MAG: CPBP family intramembrane metalloprotease [Elusimicrobia bacterium]|nr:CPBP family intramembrane metalloprotease [Elusimicrobiota bacterium]